MQPEAAGVTNEEVSSEDHEFSSEVREVFVAVSSFRFSLADVFSGSLVVDGSLSELVR